MAKVKKTLFIQAPVRGVRIRTPEKLVEIWPSLVGVPTYSRSQAVGTTH
jgi:hypothetical protein